jgi:hypothetical protein
MNYNKVIYLKTICKCSITVLNSKMVIAFKNEFITFKKSEW